jgi:hypothetical protein
VIANTFADRNSNGQKPRLHFISVGSALNPTWDVAPVSEQYRFYRGIAPNVRWLDLWSQQDPGPRGRLRPPSAVPADQVSSETVMNRMNIVQDHTSYWGNLPEVVARILKEVSGGARDDDLKMDVQSHRARVRVLGVLLLGTLLVFPLGFLIGFVVDARPLLSSLVIGGVAMLVYYTVANLFWGFWDSANKNRRVP